MNLMEAAIAAKLGGGGGGGGAVSSVNGQTGDVVLDANDVGAASATNPIPDSVKTALLNCFDHVAWADTHGQDYYNALEAALYSLDHITAVYTQSGTVYDTDSLDSLKADLVVTAFYQNGESKVVTTYTLSGTLTVGTNTITVFYGGKTATFDVVVVAGNLFDPVNDPNVNMIIDAARMKYAEQPAGYQYAYASSYISVQPNQTYTITKTPTNQFRVGTSQNIPANKGDVLQTEANHTGSSITITTGATANYLFFTYWYNVGDYNEQEVRNSIFIEKGA